MASIVYRMFQIICDENSGERVRTNIIDFYIFVTQNLKDQLYIIFNDCYHTLVILVFNAFYNPGVKGLIRYCQLE